MSFEKQAKSVKEKFWRAEMGESDDYLNTDLFTHPENSKIQKNSLHSKEKGALKNGVILE